MSKPVTYLQLDVALRRLGFQRVVPPDAPMGYQHADSETVILLRNHRQEDFVPAGTLGATRKVLVDRGLTDPEAWDLLLQTAAA